MPLALHFDVPRLRTSTSSGYLTSGIAYASELIEAHARGLDRAPLVARPEAAP